MKIETHKLRFPFVILSLVIYNFFFWNDKFGINLPLFTTLLLAFQLVLNPVSILSNRVRITLAGTLLSGVMVVLFNSFSSKFAHVTSFFLTTVFIHHFELRSILYAIPTFVFDHIYVQSFLLKGLGRVSGQSKNARKLWRYFKLIVIPAIVLGVFYVLYAIANPKFKSLVYKLTVNFFDWVENFIGYLSFSRIVFLLLGLFLITGAIYYSAKKFFSNVESEFDDPLVRKRLTRFKVKISNSLGESKTLPGFSHFKMNALKNELRIAIILITAVNVMLLVVNVVDINWVWINFLPDPGFNLSQFVHEGTYILIMSILLSIAILLYFFRQNLNFYSKNKWLKILGIIWMIQNLLLVISVALRNFHYINYHGLAYKRIGVFIFLALTVFGIITVLIKVLKVKSAYYLFRINGWSAYIMLILMAFMNWDVIIARHNLNHKYPANIDVQFLMTLSDKTLPLMFENKMELKKEVLYYYYNDESKWLEYENELEWRKQKFTERQSDFSFLSWNWQDQKVKKYFTAH